MKRREFERQLKKEIKVSASFDVTQITGEPCKKSFSMRRMLAFAMSLILIVGVCAMFPLIGNAFSPKASGGGTIIIDINPSIELTYNSKGVITKVQGLNSDGQMLLSQYSFKGLTYSEAVDKIVEESKSLGYFSPDRDTNAVLISVLNSKNKTNSELENKLGQRFDKAFDQNGLFGVVIFGDNSGESENGVSAQKLALIKEIISLTPEEDAQEDYYQKSISWLYSKLEECQNNSIINSLLAEIDNVIENIEGRFKEQIEALSFLLINCPDEIDKDDIMELDNAFRSIPQNKRELLRALSDCYNQFSMQWKMEHDENMPFELRGKEKPDCPPPDIQQDRREQITRDFKNDWFGMQEEWRREVFG